MICPAEKIFLVLYMGGNLLEGRANMNKSRLLEGAHGGQQGFVPCESGGIGSILNVNMHKLGLSDDDLKS